MFQGFFESYLCRVFYDDEFLPYTLAEGFNGRGKYIDDDCDWTNWII